MSPTRRTMSGWWALDGRRAGGGRGPRLRRVILVWVAVLSAALLGSGCASAILARRIATAPNVQSPPRPLEGEGAKLFPATYAADFRVPVGPPAAELAVAVIEPGYYWFNHTLALRGAPGGTTPFDLTLRWWPLVWPPPTDAAGQSMADPRPADAWPAGATPKGTIVLLHGILVNRETTIHWALRLAEAGYRTVLVDLRGHGASTGEWITFGATEAADLTQVLDALVQRNLAAAGRVGVLGVSYGGVMGLHWAARDARVAAVVALEPFSDARQAIREFSRAYGGPQVAKLSDGTFASAAGRVARLGGFRWENVDVLASVRRLRGPALFIHGAHDTWVPPLHSERLLAVAPAGSRRIVAADDNHLSLSARLAPLDAEVVAWFDAQLAGEAPSVIAPASTSTP